MHSTDFLKAYTLDLSLVDLNTKKAHEQTADLHNELRYSDDKTKKKEIVTELRVNTRVVLVTKDDAVIILSLNFNKNGYIPRSKIVEEPFRRISKTRKVNILRDMEDATKRFKISKDIKSERLFKIYSDQKKYEDLCVKVAKAYRHLGFCSDLYYDDVINDINTNATTLIEGEVVYPIILQSTYETFKKKVNYQAKIK
jgi:hypothetical protein